MSVASAQQPQCSNETGSKCTAKEAQQAEAVWRALFNFTTKQDIPLLCAASACSLVSSVANPIQAFLTGKVFDGFVKFAIGSISADGLVAQQRSWILYLVAVAAGSWISHGLEFALWIRFGEVQARNARAQLYTGLAAMDIAWYDLCEDGIEAYLSRLQVQIRDLQLATSQPLGGVLALVSTALIALGQAFYNSWSLTLVTLAGAPIVVATVAIFGVRMQRAIDQQDLARSTIQSHALEAFANVETVKCFNAQQIELARYSRNVAEAAKYYLQIIASNGWQMAILAFLIQAMFVQAFYYGGVLIRDGSKQPAQVITTFLSAITAFQSIQGILPQIVVLEKGKFAGAALKEAMPASGPSHDQHRQDIKPMQCHGHFELRNIRFAFPARPNQLALNDVNLSIPPSCLTFLVGQSGSGKSTIGQLLTRFYDVEGGDILLDGQNLSTLDLRWLRSNVMLVDQSSTLFSGTVKQNLTLGQRQGATVDASKVQQAVEFALLQTMVLDMPDGLQTKLGHLAQSISGGQRQRLALARARIIDPSVLILDESTSALDQVSRELMMAAIRKWRKGKTTIIVTHDLTQIGQDDQVVVLAGGRVVQQGLRADIEQRHGSAFAALLAGTSITGIAQGRHQVSPAAVTAPASSKSRHRTSFFETASIYLDTLPFQGLTSRGLLRRSSTGDRSTSPSEHHLDPQQQPQSMELPLAQRCYELVMNAGQVVVAQRRSTVPRSRRGFQHSEKVAETQEGHTLEQPGLYLMVRELWLDSTHKLRLCLAVGVLGATLHATCSPVFSWVLARLLGLYAQPGDTSRQSLTYALAILGIAATDATATLTYRRLVELGSQCWVDTLRRRAAAKLFDQPQDFFDNGKDTAGSLVETLDQHAEEMRNMFGRFVIMLWIAAAILVISFIWAMTIQWKLTLLAMAAAPYIYTVAQIFTRVSEMWERRSTDATQELSLIFNEAFGKVRTVRSLAIEEHFKRKYTAAVSHTLKVGIMRGCWTGALYGMSSSAEHFATAFVFFIGTKLAHDGASIPDILQVFSILILSISNITGILDYVPQMSSAKEMAWRVLRLANLPTVASTKLRTTHIRTIGPIEFKRLTFAYPARPTVVVLKNMNLNISAGMTTAIVGGSGSGKSTIAKLLLGLYDPLHDEGVAQRSAMRISGRDMRSISIESIRQVTAVVAQVSPLFQASILSNIKYGLLEGSSHATMSNVIRATKQAGIYDFITSLPDSFETMIGSGGIGVSGGQSQRIAIARALVRRPSLLILDEATSALDSASSLLVRETIRQLIQQSGGRMTIVMITHSRDMMACADQVVVLEHGRVVESGGFQYLLDRRGHLARLLSGGSIEE